MSNFFIVMGYNHNTFQQNYTWGKTIFLGMEGGFSARFAARMREEMFGFTSKILYGGNWRSFHLYMFVLIYLKSTIHRSNSITELRSWLNSGRLLNLDHKSIISLFSRPIEISWTSSETKHFLCDKYEISFWRRIAVPFNWEYPGIYQPIMLYWT